MLHHRLRRIAPLSAGPENTGFIYYGSADGGSTSGWTYSLVTGTIASSTASHSANYQKCGFANTTKGVITGGSTTGVSLYTISDMSRVNGTGIGNARDSAYSASTADTGYVYGGVGYSTSTKYSYSGNSWSSTTSLSQVQQRGSAHNNSTTALLLGGSLSNNTTILTTIKVFTFSGETFGTDAALTTGRSLFNGSAGDQTRALAMGGVSTWSTGYVLTIEDIKFSDRSKTARTSLASGREFRSHAAAGNDVHGVWIGGYTSAGITRSNDYNYITDTVSNGTTLPSAVFGHSSFSSTQIR